MKNWFQGLESREQLFVSLGVVIVVAALFYGFVWAPLDRNHAAMENSVADWHRSLAEAVRDPDELIDLLSLADEYREPARQAATLGAPP